VLKQLAYYLGMAVSCLGLLYLILPSGYDAFHRGFLHTFFGMIGVIVWVLIGGISVWKIFSKPKKKSKQPVKEVNQHIELDMESSDRRRRTYFSKLKDLPNQSEFKRDIENSKNQIDRFERYIDNIRSFYKEFSRGDKFDSAACERAINGAIKLFYSRIDSMIAYIRTFDSDEYKAFRNGELDLKSEKSTFEKKELFDKTFRYVDQITDNNEEMVLAVHKMLLGMTEKSATKEWDSEAIQAVKKLADYIETTERAMKLDSEVGATLLKQLSGGPAISEFSNIRK